jgi:hypothetical protein
MLRREQFRQLGKQIQFELPGNSLSHILAKLSAPNSLLNSGREILWHRNANLAGRASMLDLHNHIARNDVRRDHPAASPGSEQRKQLSRLQRLIDDLESGNGLDGPPSVLPEPAAPEQPG